jgi:hypothetical protein
MIITKTCLPRRTFLRGMGVTLAVPLLDAMVPALSAIAKTAANPVKRLGFVYIPNGANMSAWTPKGEGRTFELTNVMSALEPFRDRITVLSGLANKPADAWGDGGGDHSRGPAAYLNGVHPKRTEGADIQAATTIDQIVARQAGAETQLASLELSTEATDLVGNCGGAGYSCVYIDTLCWRSPTTPLPMENNPRTVFEQLFGDGATAAERSQQLRENRSILDAVTRELAGFQRKLGAADRTRVNEYLDAIREIERRIQKAEQQSDLNLSLPDRPVGVPESWEEHVKLMFDLQVLAYQADITRVITFMMSRELSQRAYVNLGITDPHHGISHHQDDPEKLAKLAKINAYHLTLLAYYLEKLRAIPDGDGSLLEHVMVLYGGGLADGNLHTHAPLPILLAGGASGTLQGGRHVQCPKDTPLANLLLAMVHKMGVPADRIGDSTEPLTI